ncbi:MAG: PQQ-binding-like beta-propeller repeat protein [Verrucomicrobiota bacterium]
MRLIPLLFATALLTSIAHAENWPRFRGPQGSGISEDKNIPVKIEKKHFQWTANLPGDGVSSPVVFGDKIFLTSMGKGEDERCVVAVSAKDGKQLWKKAYDFTIHHKHRYNSFAASTPVCDAERVYVSWADSEGRDVIALSHDGNEVWRKKVDDSYFAKHGSSASPILSEGVLIITNEKDEEGAFIVGLNPATGDEKWKLERGHEGHAPYNTPTEFLPVDSPPLLLFNSTEEGITAVHPSSGKVAWKFDAGFSSRCVASTSVAGEFIFAHAGQGGGGKQGVAIRSIGGATPDFAWDLNIRIPYVPTAIGYNGHFYMLKDNGTLNCVRASDGEVLWDERTVGEAYASPICVNGYLYCISRQGEMAVVKTGDKHEIVSKFDFDGPVNATPAISNGKMFVRVGDKLHCIAK